MAPKKQNKPKKKNNSNAMVVYQGKNKNIPKNNPGKERKLDTLTLYRAALSRPFSNAALGGRVPDMFCIPTNTVHLTRRYTVTTNGSGEADIIVFPSGYWHMVSPRGNLAGAGTWSALDGTNTTNAVVYTPTADLSAKLVNYRIVGMGVRVLGTASATTTNGVVLIAKSPISSYINSVDALGGVTSNSSNSGATLTNSINAYGFPATSNKLDLSAVLTLPGSVETSLMNITENPLEVTSKITSPEAFDFRMTKDNALGFNVTDQTSLTNVKSGDASFLRLAGFEAICIGLTGCTANTSVAEVEVIYHLEGQPFVGAASYIASDTSAVAVDPVGWMNVVKAVANEPSVRAFATSAVNSFMPGLGSLASKFL